MRTTICAVTLISVCVCARYSEGGYTQLNVTDRVDYAFNNSGLLYISTSGGNILRYDTQTSSYLTPFNIGGSLRGIDLSPDGTTLAVADGTTVGSSNRIHFVNTTTGVDSPVSFTRQSLESGTYMVAWGADNQVLVTSTFAGSGWIPLRRHDPLTHTTITVDSVRQSSMLTPSADRNTIAIAESNISSGPITDYDVPTHSFKGSVSTDWFTFEVAVNSNGSKYVVPTYDGAFVYNKTGTSFQKVGTIGQYANHGPLAAVFSAVGNVFYTSEWSFSGTEHGVRVYNANTLSLLQTIDPYQFSWQGNGAMGQGRMEISPDGRYLAVSVSSAVRLYDVSAFVPEPAAGTLAILAAPWFLLRRRSSHL
jgi:hypothetical protein